MANEEEKKDALDQSTGKAIEVCLMSIALIITALHLNAEKNANAASKNARITNTAVEGEGKDAKVASAGEHIISVTPLKEDTAVKKEDAVALLKTYVLWFVGPDIASKVNGSVVKPLTEPVANESKKFMSFGLYLLEAEDLSEADPHDTGFGDIEADADDKEDEKKDDGKEKPKDDLGDLSKESKLGYYVPYNFKVKGLPLKALKDAMKKFAKTFFDDLTFKADGLFGGGAEFSVKDVKLKWRDAFGPIDPDDLVHKVREQIEKIQHPNTPSPTVEVRDKTTLLADLGGEVSGKLKQMIDGADYSLWIKLSEFDPKKPLFNPRVIADIVTSSIKGLFKKFKNKITKDDVIYIKDYADKSHDAKKLRDLQNLALSPLQMRTLALQKGKSAEDAYSKMKEKMDPIVKASQYADSLLGDALVKVWKEFDKKLTDKDSEIHLRMKSILNDYEKRLLFDDFLTNYLMAYDKNYDKSLDESIDALSRLLSLLCIVNVKKLVLESMFGEASDGKDDEKSGASKIDANAIVADCKSLIETNDKMPKPKNVAAKSKDVLKNMCKLFDTSAFDGDLFGDFKQGLLVDYVGLTKPLTANESVQNDILSILMPSSLDEDESTDGSALPAEFDKKALENAMRAALKSNGVEEDQCGKSLVELTPKDLVDEAKDDDTKDKPKVIAPRKAYILPFGSEDLMPLDKIGLDALTSGAVEGKGRNDLYIIPMKNLAYQDKEYNTKA